MNALFWSNEPEIRMPTRGSQALCDEMSAGYVRWALIPIVFYPCHSRLTRTLKDKCWCWFVQTSLRLLLIILRIQRERSTMSAKKDNLLLAAIPSKERERLEPFLQWVKVDLGETLIEPHEPITQMFFPYDAVTSTIQEMENGGSVETGLMGIEGLIGIQLWLQMPSTPTLTLVQVEGYGYRMKATDFIREVRERQTPLNYVIARYTHAFLIMTSIAAACNRLHTLDQRMCRWLKLVHNRVRRDEFQMRQDFMAAMLGVQRPTVSTTAHMLQQAGLITYTRGHMKVLDTEGLVDGACACYELMEREMDRIFEVPWRELARREDQKDR